MRILELENRCTGNRTEGSDPSLSAIDPRRIWLFRLKYDETPAPAPAYIVGDVSPFHLLDDRVVGTSAEQLQRIAHKAFSCLRPIIGRPVSRRPSAFLATKIIEIFTA
jgi:hypothetical protein